MEYDEILDTIAEEFHETHDHYWDEIQKQKTKNKNNKLKIKYLQGRQAQYRRTAKLFRSIAYKIALKLSEEDTKTLPQKMIDSGHSTAICPHCQFMVLIKNTEYIAYPKRSPPDSSNQDSKSTS